jgi:hypothetical protein
VVAIQNVINDFKEEKRKEAADLRDKEYHEKRMEAYK